MRPRVWEAGYAALVITLLGLALIPLYIQGTRGDWHDFDVFFQAAKAVLAGDAVHRITGRYDLPFWYPPWIAWAYLPFAFLSRAAGLLVYQALSLVSAVLILHILPRYYNPNFNWLDELFMLMVTIPMGFQVLIVGQMEFLFLALLVAIILAAERKWDIVVALLFPFLLAKPHLVLLFSIVLFWRIGWRGLVVSLGLTAGMLLMATLMRPGWHLEMLAVLQRAGARTDGLEFTTLAALFGRQENWIGTANLPLAFALFCVGLFVLWKVRWLSTVPLLSLALALSLLVAPRAYAYDLPLLIPALVWITADRFRRKIWLWVLAALIPLLTGYGSVSYLLTILVSGLGVWRALRESAAPSRLAAQPLGDD